jgi:two-component system LytT family sensor kinase
MVYERPPNVKRFTDIYSSGPRMRKPFKIRNPKLYLWTGIAAVAISLLTNAAEHMDRSYWLRIADDIWKLIYLLAVNYSLFEITLPKLGWQRLGSSILRILAYVFLYSGGFLLWRRIGIALHIYIVLDPLPSSSDVAASLVGDAVGSVIFFAIIRHIYNHIRLKRSAQRLLIEKQAAELNFLKSQTNPHFLFNTLNNIYALARDKSDLAPESIMRLSKILRYMLYETGSPFTAIEQDLKVIGDYIALERLRYDDTLRVNFNYDIEDMKQALPPLLLMPLVENAFKHGASETRSRPFVDIHLTVKNRRLVFIVKNSTGEPVGEATEKENIGLSNLRRQLELQYTDYDLSLQKAPFLYTATLNINLASHV